MSSGSRIKLYAALETSAGVLPVVPEWFVVPRVTDGLTENVTTTESEITKDTRFREGNIPVQSEVTGDLASELSISTFDLFFAALAMNDWESDVLSFGGVLRKTFTFIKVYDDQGIIHKYSGVAFNTGTLSISNGEKVSVNFGLVGSGFEHLDTNPVVNPKDLMTSPLVSSLNVQDFLLNGQTVVGTACLQSMELEINNNMQAVYCIGNGKMSAEKQIEGVVDINLSTNFMFSGQVDEYHDKIKSGATTAISFSIEDAVGNAYDFDFPRLQVTEAAHPDAGGSDLVTIDIAFAHIQVTPTITRTIAVRATGVNLTPATATIEVGNTTQLNAAVTPANVTNDSVTFVSSNPSVATVSDTGLVTAVAVGEAVITVTTADGSFTKQSTITVE